MGESGSVFTSVGSSWTLPSLMEGVVRSLYPQMSVAGRQNRSEVVIVVCDSSVLTMPLPSPAFASDPKLLSPPSIVVLQPQTIKHRTQTFSVLNLSSYILLPPAETCLLGRIPLPWCSHIGDQETRSRVGDKVGEGTAVCLWGGPELKQVLRETGLAGLSFLP